MRNVYCLLLLIAISINSITAQVSDDLWTKTSVLEKKSFQKQKMESLPTIFQVYDLDYKLLKSKLSNVASRDEAQSISGAIITFPNEKGELEKFNVFEASIMEEGLQRKYPAIRSYIGKGVDNPSAIIRFSITSLGLKALILSNTENLISIEPYTKDKSSYIIYSKSTLPKKEPFECGTEELQRTTEKNSFGKLKNANDSKLRIYRLAVTATGEYSQWVLENEQIPTTASEAKKKETVLSSIVVIMTNVNAIFERDLALTMVLVANNKDIIFLDPDTDELSGKYGFALLDENPPLVDKLIGTDNYDIGHVFSIGLLDVGGVVSGSSVCKDYKARGASNAGANVILHEMGHQFGATHTFNNCGPFGNGGVDSGVEIGCGGKSGSLMSYSRSYSPYFHLVSIKQIWNFITVYSSCATIQDIDNKPPNLEAISNYSLPISTPFVLKAFGSDVDGDNLTYTFEQLDTEQGPFPMISSATVGPAFYTKPPDAASKRYFPSVGTVIDGFLSNQNEVLPTSERTMSFGINIRDNNIKGGQTESAKMKISFDANSGPFTITSPSVEETWEVGSTKNINWAIANTDKSPVNCSHVIISLSIDGGFTFPIILASNAENNGSYQIQVPDVSTNGGKIKVESKGNIFYSMSSGFISINPPMGKTFVPDNNFEQALINMGYDDTLDDYVTTDNIKSLTSLDLNSKNIKILKGIEDFKGLESFNCAGNNLIKLDMRRNTYLADLNCSGNDIIELDISNNRGLETLICTNNDLHQLDVSHNLDLTLLLCSSNYLSNLDVSKNLKLTDLNCADNDLIELDISNHTGLKTLICSNNDLNQLNVSKNLDLTRLLCSSNYLSNLDVSKNLNLTQLNVRENNLNEINLSVNTSLTFLDCAYNNLNSLDVSNIVDLTRLWCSTNNLSSLDVSNNTVLTELWSYNNIINCIQVNQNQLDSYSTIWLKDDITTYSLNCNGDDDNDGVNNIEDMCAKTPSGEISDNYGCSISQKTYIPDDNFELALIEFGIDDFLDDYVRKYKINEIENLDIKERNIKDLTGIEGFIDLEYLRCENNEIGRLDLSKNPSLKSLICSNNKLTELNISENTVLDYVYCIDNNLTNIDASNNFALKTLVCSNNRLVSLNLKNGNNTNITGFYSQGNPDLNCIQVDDINYSKENWIWIDPWSNFNEDCQYVLGIDEELTSESFVIYPNPAANYLNIRTETQINRIDIYSLQGQKILSFQNNLHKIDLKRLAPGIYLVKLFNELGTSVKKLIKE